MSAPSLAPRLVVHPSPLAEAASSIPPASIAATPPPSASAAAAPYDPAAHRNTAGGEWVNWSSTQRCRPAYFHTPRTVEELRAILAYASARQETVRCVGYGHSPGPAAVTDGHLVAMGVHFHRILAIDRDRQQVTCESGISLAALNAALYKEGLALPILGSISDQTLAGALACGTHGSTVRGHATIAAYCTALELLDASGRLWQCSRTSNPDLFDAARISLGALGVITQVTIQCEGAFDLVETSVTIPFREWVDPARFQALLHHPDADMVRFHWMPHTERVLYTRMKKVAPALAGKSARAAVAEGTHSGIVAVESAKTLPGPAVPVLHRARAAVDRFIGFHMLQALYYLASFGGLDRLLVPRIAQVYGHILYPQLQSAAAALPSTGARAAAAAPSSSSSSVLPSSSSSSSAWIRRDRADRILNFDCLFQQYVTEWAIDQRFTTHALLAVREYIEQQGMSVHFPIEVRFSGGRASGVSSSVSSGADGDGIWLSPCYAAPQTWIGIIMYRPYGREPGEWRRYFQGFERIMNGLVPRVPSSAPAAAALSSSLPTAPITTASISPSPSFEGKPHWAKNVVIPLADIPLSQRYPRWTDFLAMRQRLDPQGVFRNELIRQLEEASRTREQGQVMNTAPIQSKL